MKLIALLKAGGYNPNRIPSGPGGGRFTSGSGGGSGAMPSSQIGRKVRSDRDPATERQRSRDNDDRQDISHKKLSPKERAAQDRANEAAAAYKEKHFGSKKRDSESEQETLNVLHDRVSRLEGEAAKHLKGATGDKKMVTGALLRDMRNAVRVGNPKNILSATTVLNHYLRKLARK